MYNTQRMADSNSLAEFYEKSMIQEYSGYDYPFGLWYFGSIVMKLTGLDVYVIAYLIPLLLLFGTLLIYYCYAFEFVSSRDQSILSLIFLISMPMLAVAQLNLSTSIFVMPLLVAILFLAVRPYGWRNAFLILILVFTLCFTHTGTFIFLISFAIVYFLLRALIWKRIELNFFILVVALLFCYTTIVQIFPFIQPQYIDKGRLITSTTLSIASALHLDIIHSAGEVFYDTILVSNNYVFAFLWSAMIFVTAKLLLYLRRHADTFFVGKNYPAAIPIIGNITSLSKGILTTPLWVGPIHSLLSIPGIFRIDSRGKCIALTLVFTSLIPGALGGSEGTGVLREIYYLLLIIPVTSAAGFYYIQPSIDRYGQSLIKKIFVVFIYIIIILPLIVAPIVACLHYQPTITMTNEEKTNLLWLGTVGEPIEGAAGNAYRDRMTMYANKSIPSIPAGTATKQFTKDLYATYFSSNPEESTRDLSSYQVKYLILSDRTLKGFTQPKDLIKIDSNRQVDKIYSSGKFFGIYKIISSPPVIKTTITEPIAWKEEDSETTIRDVGSVFLVENDYYKIKLSDSAPKFRYMGTRTNDMLGEGDYSDVVVLIWDYLDNSTPQSVTIDLNSLKYPDIKHSNNVLMYTTVITNENHTERLASLTVKYTFFDKAFRREILIANDMAENNRTPDLTAIMYSSLFAPMDYFEFFKIDADEKTWVKKKIYPAEDSVNFNNIQFNGLYFNEGSSGLYIRFDPTSPYPTQLTYKGSPYYNYGTVTRQNTYELRPAENVQVTEYYAIDPKVSAMKNVEKYSSVSLYNYPEGKIPLIITGSMDQQRTNESGERESAARSMLNEFNITYVLGIPITNVSEFASVAQYRTYNIGSMRIYSNKLLYKDASVQENEIQKLASDSIHDVIIPSFRYDFTTIRLLINNSINDAMVLPVQSPREELFREGYREIKYATIDGEQKDFVLMPVTLPDSRSLNPLYDTDDIFTQWNDTIDSVAENGGIAVFLWDLNDIGEPEYSQQITGVLQRSVEKNFTPTTPDSVAEHYRSLKNINISVQRGDDYVILDAHNNALADIFGVTYMLDLPVISGGCPYTIQNGKITRQSINNDYCRIFASFNIAGMGDNRIIIASSAIKEKFNIDIPVLYQGENILIVKNFRNETVPGADVFVGTKYYETDEDGKVTISVIRGETTIRIQKAGYETTDMTVIVKPAIYRYLPVTGK